MSVYQIERLSLANLKHLQTLYRSTYSKRVSIKYLEGKYQTAAFGVEWLGYIAFTEHHKPVAFYGVIPCHFRLNNQLYLAAQSADTMTHPDHQRKGLFMQLAKETYELARQEGVQFIFGFPNQNSYPGFVKLNWQFMPQPMQYFVLKGSKYPFAALLLKIPLLKKLYGLYENSIIEKFSKRGSEIDHSSESGLVRNALFFQYKNQYNMTFIKKWDNAYAWMRNDGTLKVGLIHFDNNESPHIVATSITDVAKKLGCKTVLLMTSLNTPVYNLLIQITSAKDGLPIGFYNLTDRYLEFNQSQFEYCDIDIF